MIGVLRFFLAYLETSIMDQFRNSIGNSCFLGHYKG